MSLSLSLPAPVLSIHIAPLRGGGGPPWSGLGLPSPTSHHYHQGPSPSSPSHPPTTTTTTKSSPSFSHCSHSFLHRSQSFVRWGFCACVASCIVGYPRSGLVVLRAKSFFEVTETVKIDCRRTPHFHCVCFRGGTSAGVRLAQTKGLMVKSLHISLFFISLTLACTRFLFLCLLPPSPSHLFPLPPRNLEC